MLIFSYIKTWRKRIYNEKDGADVENFYIVRNKKMARMKLQNSLKTVKHNFNIHGW